MIETRLPDGPEEPAGSPAGSVAAPTSLISIARVQPAVLVDERCAVAAPEKAERFDSCPRPAGGGVSGSSVRDESAGGYGSGSGSGSSSSGMPLPMPLSLGPFGQQGSAAAPV